MAWMYQQVRTRMSWARKYRDQELWDALNEMKDGMIRNKETLRMRKQRELKKAWPEKHLLYWSVRDAEDRVCNNTRLLSASLVEGWHIGIPPHRSLAWFFAQKRPLNAVMVAEVLHRCKTPYIAWEFFRWSAGVPGFQHTPTTCAMLFRTYFLGNQPDAALNFFKKALPDLCNPSELLYNVMIQGLCLAGRVDDAVKLYEEMTGVSCVPRPGKHTNAILKKGLIDNGYSPGDDIFTKIQAPARPRRRRRLTNRNVAFPKVVLPKNRLIARCRRSATVRMKPSRVRSPRRMDFSYR